MSYYFSSPATTAANPPLPTGPLLNIKAVNAQAAIEASKQGFAAACAVHPMIRAKDGVKVGARKGRGKRRGVLVFPKMGSLAFDNLPYQFVQTIRVSPVSSSATVPTFGTYYFTLTQVDQYASFTAVFDQYRVKMLEVSFNPRANTSNESGGTSNLFYTVIDYDDASSLTSLAQAGDYSNCMSTEMTKKQVRTFVPHIAVAAYSGTFTSFSNEEAPWIDAGSTGVVHYGVKWASEISTQVNNYDVLYRVWLEFRNVR